MLTSKTVRGLLVHVQRLLGQAAGFDTFWACVTSDFCKRTESMLGKGTTSLIDVTPQKWKEFTLDKEIVADILSDKFIKHHARKLIEPTHSLLAPMLQSYKEFCKAVSVTPSRKDVTACEDANTAASEAICSMHYCMYIYKKIPKAPSNKSKAALIRELKSHTRQFSIPDVLQKRLHSLSKATAKAEAA